MNTLETRPSIKTWLIIEISRLLNSTFTIFSAPKFKYLYFNIFSDFNHYICQMKLSWVSHEMSLWVPGKISPAIYQECTICAVLAFPFCAVVCHISLLFQPDDTCNPSRHSQSIEITAGLLSPGWGPVMYVPGAWRHWQHVWYRQAMCWEPGDIGNMSGVDRLCAGKPGDIGNMSGIDRLCAGSLETLATCLV